MAREIQLEIDALGRLDRPEQLAAARLQRLREGRSSVPGLRRLDDGLDFLAELLIGYAEHRGVCDARILQQHVLDLLRVDVDAARDDDEVLAVGEVQIAFSVDMSDVAEGAPALRTGGRAGLARIVPVLESGVALEVDLPGFPGRQL